MRFRFIPLFSCLTVVPRRMNSLEPSSRQMYFMASWTMRGPNPRGSKRLGGVIQRKYLADLDITTGIVAARHPHQGCKTVNMKEIRSRTIRSCLFGPLILLGFSLLCFNVARGQGFSDW